jgi:hypothetical protein
MALASRQFAIFVFLVLLVASAMAQSGSARPATVENVQVLGSDSDLRVEITLSTPVNATVITATNPDRLVVQLPNTISDGKQQRIPVNYQGIRSVRVGLNGAIPPETHLVVDLEHAVPYSMRTEGNRIILMVNSNAPNPGVAPTSPAAASVSSASNSHPRRAAPKVISDLPGAKTRGTSVQAKAKTASASGDTSSSTATTATAQPSSRAPAPPIISDTNLAGVMVVSSPPTASQAAPAIATAEVPASAATPAGVPRMVSDSSPPAVTTPSAPASAPPTATAEVSASTPTPAAEPQAASSSNPQAVTAPEATPVAAPAPVIANAAPAAKQAETPASAPAPQTSPASSSANSPVVAQTAPAPSKSNARASAAAPQATPGGNARAVTSAEVASVAAPAPVIANAAPAAKPAETPASAPAPQTSPTSPASSSANSSVVAQTAPAPSKSNARASAAAAPVISDLATVRDVQVQGAGDDLRIDITLSIPVKADVITAVNPDRIVLELENTIAAGKQKHIPIDYEGIHGVRFGLNSASPPETHVVVDLAEARPFKMETQGNHVILTVSPPTEVAKSHQEGSAPAAGSSGSLAGIFRRRQSSPSPTVISDVPVLASRPATQAEAPAQPSQPAAAGPGTTAASRPTAAHPNLGSLQQGTVIPETGTPGAGNVPSVAVVAVESANASTTASTPAAAATMAAPASDTAAAASSAPRVAVSGPAPAIGITAPGATVGSPSSEVPVQTANAKVSPSTAPVPPSSIAEVKTPPSEASPTQAPQVEASPASSVSVQVAAQATPAPTVPNVQAAPSTRDLPLAGLPPVSGTESPLAPVVEEAKLEPAVIPNPPAAASAPTSVPSTPKLEASPSAQPTPAPASAPQPSPAAVPLQTEVAAAVPASPLPAPSVASNVPTPGVPANPAQPGAAAAAVPGAVSSSEATTSASASSFSPSETEQTIMALNAADPNLRTVFRVKYVAEGVAYLDGGRSSGLAEGMKLEIKNTNLAARQGAVVDPGDPRVIAELKVSAVADTSAVTDISETKSQVKPGDLAYLSVLDAQALVQQQTLSATRAYPAVVTFTGDNDPLEEEARAEVPRPPMPSVNRARGQIGFDYMGTVSHGNPGLMGTDLGMIVRADITRINGSYWNLNGFWRGRITQESVPTQQTLQNLMDRTYTLGLTYASPNSPLVIGIGRLYLPWATSLDTIDGGYLGVQVGHGATVGAFAGSTPDPTSWSYNPDQRIAGSFVNFQGGSYDAFHYTSTTGIGISTIDWRIQKPFVFAENNFSYKRFLSIYDSTQADAPRGTPAVAAPGAGLSMNFFTLRLQPVSRIELDFNHSYFRDIPTFNTTLVGTGLLDKYLFQGFSGAARVEVVKNIFVYSQIGRSSRSGDASNSWNQMYGFTLGKIPIVHVRTDVHYTKFDSAFGSGSYRAFSVSRNLSENFRLEVLAGDQSFNSSLTSADHARFVTSNLESSFGAHYFLQGGYTVNRGNVENYDQWLLTLGYRFDSRANHK